MLYYFLVPLAKDHIVFNVFRYLTFRSFMALISAFIISLVVGPWIIRQLRIAQHGGETIREDTPERHRTKKGTPTMGGLVILTALIATTLLWANLANRYIWVAVLATGGSARVLAAGSVRSFSLASGGRLVAYTADGTDIWLVQTDDSDRRPLLQGGSDRHSSESKARRGRLCVGRAQSHMSRRRSQIASSVAGGI